MVFDVAIATRGAEAFCRRHLPPEMHDAMIRKLVLRAELGHDRRLARLLMEAGLAPPSDEYVPLDLGRAPPLPAMPQTLWDHALACLQETGADRPLPSIRRIDSKLEFIDPFRGCIRR